MSQADKQIELKEKTQQLLHGSLKHVRAAALAVALVPLASVTVSHVQAQGCNPCGGTAPCPNTIPVPCDFVTSGGFVIKDVSGKEANFGAHGGCKKDGFWGHLNYVDHETGYHVDSLDITAYLAPVPGTTTRDVCGTARTNTEALVYFRIRLVDNGEPGVADLFGIRLSNGYYVAPRLLGRGMTGGGNIQLHGPNPSTTGPSSGLDDLTLCNGVAAP